jgi:TolB protein
MKLASLATLLWLATALPAISEAPVVMKRLTNVIDSYPQFSKDGKLLLFQSNRSGKTQIYVGKADGTDIRRLTHLDFPAAVPCWSPDMSRIVFAGEPAGHSEIFVMNADGSGIVQLTHRRR